MKIIVPLKTTLLTIVACIALLFSAASPANAQGEFLSPTGAPYALVVAGMGFIAGYTSAPHLVRVWMEKSRRTNSGA